MVNPTEDPLLAYLARLARDGADRLAGARERRVWADAARQLGVELERARSRRGLHLAGRLLGHAFSARNAPSPRGRSRRRSTGATGFPSTVSGSRSTSAGPRA